MSQLIERNSQLIKVLCLGTGTEDEILTTLLGAFPLTAWTLEQVQTYLLAGAKSGIFTKVAIDPARWQIRRDMAVINTKNIIYQELCSQIQRVYSKCNSGLL